MSLTSVSSVNFVSTDALFVIRLVLHSYGWWDHLFVDKLRKKSIISSCLFGIQLAKVEPSPQKKQQNRHPFLIITSYQCICGSVTTPLSYGSTEIELVKLWPWSWYPNIDFFEITVILMGSSPQDKYRPHFQCLNLASEWRISRNMIPEWSLCELEYRETQTRNAKIQVSGLSWLGMSSRNLYKHEDGPHSQQVRASVKGFVRCCMVASEQRFTYASPFLWAQSSDFSGRLLSRHLSVGHYYDNYL